MYAAMLLARTFDTKAINLQRTGKLGTYASCLGQEATHVGVGAAMRPEDCLAIVYREIGAQFWRGVRMTEVLLYWGGDERGNDFAVPDTTFPGACRSPPRRCMRPAPRWRSRFAGSSAARWLSSATAALPRRVLRSDEPRRRRANCPSCSSS